MFNVDYKDGQYDRQEEQQAQQKFAEELQRYLSAPKPKES
jgi:hypothetical protein